MDKKTLKTLAKSGPLGVVCTAILAIVWYVASADDVSAMGWFVVFFVLAALMVGGVPLTLRLQRRGKSR